MRATGMREIRRLIRSKEAAQAFSYLMFWAQSERDGLFHVVAAHVSPERAARLRTERGDGKTFASEMRPSPPTLLPLSLPCRWSPLQRPCAALRF